MTIREASAAAISPARICLRSLGALLESKALSGKSIQASIANVDATIFRTLLQKQFVYGRLRRFFVLLLPTVSAKRHAYQWPMRFILPIAILWTTNLSVAWSYTFTPIEYPGSEWTMPFAIDGNRVVGQYSGGAFIYENGVYATFTLPEGDVFALDGIDGPNLTGLMYHPASSQQRGFWYDGSTTHIIDNPYVNSGLDADYVDGIDGGIVVGSSYRAQGGFQAFSFDGATYHPVDYPTANFPPGTFSTAFLDIDNGTILGAYEVASQEWQNFVYDGVNFTPLPIPTTTPYISAQGIDNGIIVGVLNGAGYYYDGSIHSFSHPLSSNGTVATAISGPNIVGYYRDVFGREHGFLVTIPEPPTCLLAVCAFPIFAWYSRRRL